MAINTIIDLNEYAKRLERQKEVLKFSLLFSDQEKQEVAKCYDEIIAICDNRINGIIGANEPIGDLINQAKEAINKL